MNISRRFIFKLVTALLLVLAVTICILRHMEDDDSRYHEVILYELSEEALDAPIPDIPYYREGNILFLNDVPAEQRSTWLNSPLDVTFVCCRNLFGDSRDISLSPQSPDAEIVWNDTDTAIMQISFPDGLQFTRLPDTGKNKIVEIIVPDTDQQDRMPGRYTVTLTNPSCAPTVLFIRSITFHSS